VTRDELGHLLRAASQTAEEPDVIVVGSQAILGSFPDTWLPAEVIGSIEADFCFLMTSMIRRRIESTGRSVSCQRSMNPLVSTVKG
jgi:hypothetical protein